MKKKINKKWGYRQGEFKPLNENKYKGTYPIIYRSSWELKFAMFCDRTPSIISWGSESFIVNYFDPTTKKPRRYYLDFNMVVKDKNGNYQKYIIEIKPQKETISPVKGRKQINTYQKEVLTFARNQAKWIAASQEAKKRGYKFIVLTEASLQSF